MKLTEVFNKFIEDTELEKKETTLDTFKYRFKIILDYFQDMDIQYIDYDMVRQFQKKLYKEDKFSATYVNHVVGVLKQLMNYAYSKKIIDYNPLTMVHGVKDTKVKEEKITYDLRTYQTFSSFITDKTDHLIFDLLFYLGLRKGELIALKWKNVDLVEGIVTIDSTATNVKGKNQVITAPKTPASNRKIVVHKTLLNELKEYYFDIKKVYIQTSELFVIGNTRMLSKTTLQRKLTKYLKLAGTPKITLHGFRHSHATMLNYLTSDLKSISARLGHDNIETTLKIYVHSNIRSQQILAELIEKEINDFKKTDDFDSLIKTLQKIVLNSMSKDNFTIEENSKLIKIYQLLNTIK